MDSGNYLKGSLSVNGVFSHLSPLSVANSLFSSQLGMQAASNTHLLLLQYGNRGHGGRGKQLAAAAAAAGNGGEGLLFSVFCTPTRLCLSTFVTQ